jgi:ubiquinone/menaquinone biosynthesis C-methylase UbiE
MSRPLRRFSGDTSDLLNESQVKEKTEKDDSDKSRMISDNTYLSFKFPLSVGENGFTSDTFSSTLRNKQKCILLFLKCSLISIIFLALTGSFWWTISITSSPRAHQVYRGYRRLQEQIVSDLWDIGVLSVGSSRLKEHDFCPEEYENYVPCLNASENLELGLNRQNCLILPPKNYKIPLRWPTGKDVIWVANVKITAQEVLSSGSMTKRMMMLEEEQISFRSASPMFDGVEDYTHQIAEMIGLKNDNFIEAGIRTILDIGCGYGSFGAHLFSKDIITMCVADYESSGSQVQLTLERGLPAIIASFTSKQLPYPSLSFDLIHCARCGVHWDQKDGLFLVEVDRLLRPGGYFVWTSPLTNNQVLGHKKMNLEKWDSVRNFLRDLCWDILPQQDETVVWKKTSVKKCYTSRRPGVGPSICSNGQDIESPYDNPIRSCVGGTRSRRWIPIKERSYFKSTQLAVYGVHSVDFEEDTINWNLAIRNYWSLLSPLIFSDHPKRPGDEDPSPPYNMVRNVLDMNARFGGFNSALLESGKSVWVMNVVPTVAPNYLPLILDRGYVGVVHDWCEAFPTYPRTYDMVHADGFLSLETSSHRRCTILDIFSEIDRLLRPEGWVIFRDTAALIESARSLSSRLKWEARVVEIESNSDDRLLICQKPFFKRPAN